MLECRGSTTSLHRGLGHRSELRVSSVRHRRITDPYHATIRRAGVDIGLPQQVAVAWAVFAPTNRIGAAISPATMSARRRAPRVGVGVGANALVGGSGNTFALQPLSVQGQIGLSVAAGIAGLELRPRPLIVSGFIETPPREIAAAFSFRWSKIKHRWCAAHAIAREDGRETPWWRGGEGWGGGCIHFAD